MKAVTYQDRDRVRVIGYIDNRIFKKTIDPKKHLQRIFDNTPAIQKYPWDVKVRPFVDKIEIKAGDIAFKSSVENFDKYNFMRDFGHGKQYFMSRKYWEIEDKNQMKLI